MGSMRGSGIYMRWFFLFLLLIMVGGAAYAYHIDPDGFMHRVDNLKGQIAGLWGQAPPADSTTPEATPPTPTPQSTPVAAVAQAMKAAVPKVWSAPEVIPAQADWTWTTAQATYHKVRILKVEADCVTILDDDGGALVPISTLPSVLQQQLNYDPAAAAAASAARQRDDAASTAALARERAAGPQGGTAQTATDYQSALAQARQTGQRVLLHFTGSDWCPYCKYLESEVIETGAFQQFVAGHYIFMTVDFPRSSQLPPEIKAQNNALQQKFGVSGFPTLLVIDGNERVLGQMSGYNPGWGPGPVIARLQAMR